MNTSIKSTCCNTPIYDEEQGNFCDVCGNQCAYRVVKPEDEEDWSGATEGDR